MACKAFQLNSYDHTMSTAALDILGGLIKSISTDTSKTTDRTAREEIYSKLGLPFRTPNPHRVVPPQQAYMTKSIIPTANEKHCPPLLVLGYAIREILNPTLASNLAPELLRLLVQVEHIRKLIISNIQQALKEQEVLSQNRQKVRLLDASSTKILAKYVKKSKVQRLQYSTLTLYLRLLVSGFHQQPEPYQLTVVSAHLLSVGSRRVILDPSVDERIFPHATP